ncbi:MAG TPA: PrsW family glutamic-type intramembrane protease [Myxococcaceae bacterium]|nr:PrsW family glutamic-type intramembrane protease [Myxococcaceae bacterium]
MIPLSTALIVIAVGAGAVAWVIYFRSKDRASPEPLGLMLAVAGAGALSVPVALAGYGGFEAAGLPTEWEALAGDDLVWAVRVALRIGLVEELAKLLPVVAVVLFTRQLDEPLDGIIYAACSALGLAAGETIFLLRGGELGLTEGIARALSAPLSHALLSAPWGLGFALFLLRRQRWGLPLGLGLSILLHGAYDLLLSRPELPSFTASLLILAVWIWLLVMTPRLTAQAHPPPAPSAAVV